VLPLAVILDRDGVINADSPNYILTPAQWQPIPGSIEAIAQLNRAGIRVAVCSNQSALGRGLLTESTHKAILARMRQLLAEGQAHIDAFFICPHAPDALCDCRKPKPGLIEQTLAQWSLTPQDVILIGDSHRDIQAGTAVGVASWLVRTGNGQQTEALLNKESASKTPTFDDLHAAVQALLNGTRHE